MSLTILYHHRTLLDGAEGIHIREMIHAFETLGHSVVMLSPGTAQSHGAAGRFGEMVRRRLPRAFFEAGTAAYNVAEWRSARRAMGKLRPAFLYKRHALNDVGVLHAARAASVPSVLEVNALYSSASLGQFEPLRFHRLARAAERKALELADLVVTVSSPLSALVREIAPRVRSVLVLPNGVDATRFDPAIAGATTRARFDLPASAVVAGWCGIMRSWHGLDLLLKAIAQTRCFLFFIGDGPERVHVERMARELGVHDRVRFAGRVPEADVPAYLAAIDVGVVADDLTRYASPMKLVEYMAMGKAVVAPDLPNIRDVLSDGVEGLFFEPGMPDSLARKLASLEDAALRQALGRRGRLRVEAERTWRANARQVLHAIDVTG
ncbi:MAG TPA: glycosyltransferase family 4 protein [Vicinamibacterales bacterium]|nr:glycosyltransferase family 4 protein [Vicinamibacterales bacterium]